MRILNFSLARLIHNLYSYSYVYGMQGVCELCDLIIDRNAIVSSDLKCLRWACSSVRRRVVRDLGEYRSDRVYRECDECLHNVLIEMTELEIELDLI